MQKLEVRELLLPGFSRQVRDWGFGLEADEGKESVGIWTSQVDTAEVVSLDGNFHAIPPH